MTEQNDKTGWCQHDAGVLKGGKLSPEAEYKFIKDVQDLLALGSADAPAPPLPCGPEIPPFEHADMIDLTDREKYPDFYKNILGQYEKIALALDAKGNFSILPIMDPVALGVSLGLTPPKLDFPGDMFTFGLAIPMLAIALELTLPIDLTAKFPDVPIPGIPPIPQIPSIDFDPLQLPELFKFNSLLFDIPPKILNVVLNLIGKMPELIFKLLALDLSPFCDAVFEAEPFGPFNTSEHTTWAAAQTVLTRKTAECVTINVVGSTIGSSSGGTVGWIGGDVFGYQPPPPPETLVENIRGKIVKAANDANEFSWQKDEEVLNSSNGAASEWAEATYQYFLNSIECSEAGGDLSKQKLLHRILETKSTCGMFARACLLRGGAKGNSFEGRYNFVSGEVFEYIHRAARTHGAMRSFDVQNIPELKKGDIIHVVNHPLETEFVGDSAGHMLVVTSDYGGGASNGVVVSAVAGGLQDNDGKFKIGDNSFNFIGNYGDVPSIRYATITMWKKIYAIIDSEKLIKGTREVPADYVGVTRSSRQQEQQQWWDNLAQVFSF